MKNKVLVIAVHPDDETLGCGGTLLKHKAHGDDIHWLICTEMLEKNGFSKEAIEKRNKEIHQVAELYNFENPHYLNLSTMKVDEYSMSALISKISLIIKVVQPKTIYLPFKGDVHSDHRKIFEAAYSCTKSFRYPSVKKILMMETLSETEFAPSTKEDTFAPNYFVDISSYFEKKIQIMCCYKSEIAAHPFPRSTRNIKALATIRGATAGCEYAESFMLLKEIA